MNEDLDTTTQEDVETEGAVEAVELSERERMMQDFDARREEETKAENIKMLAEHGITQKEEVEAPVDETPKLVKVKVDGEEVEVPYDEVVTNYQKTQAADKRLRDAALERQRLDADRAELEALKASLTQKPAEPEVETPEAGMSLKEALELALEGDTDTAAERISRLITTANKPSTPGMDEAKVIQAVEQKLAEIRYQDELTRANDIFLAEYEDLNGDDTLLSIVNTQYQQLLKNGTPPVQAAKQAGDSTREWLQTKTGKPATVDTEARQQRKQNITTLPQANARTKSTQTEEPDDVSSVIAAMRRQRPGQQHY